MSDVRTVKRGHLLYDVVRDGTTLGQAAGTRHNAKVVLWNVMVDGVEVGLDETLRGAAQTLADLHDGKRWSSGWGSLGHPRSESGIAGQERLRAFLDKPRH